MAPGALWLESAYVPHALRSAAGEEQPLEVLAGRRIAAFCGIGNPAAFRQALAACGYEVVLFREFADHFPYPSAVLGELARWSDAADVAGVVCTHKDLVKIHDWSGNMPLWALASRLQIECGEGELTAALEPLVVRALEVR